jgi:hypothetical protein
MSIFYAYDYVNIAIAHSLIETVIDNDFLTREQVINHLYRLLNAILIYQIRIP